MALNGFGLAVSVSVLNIFYHDRSKAVPQWLHFLAFYVLARIACFSNAPRRGKIEDNITTDTHGTVKVEKINGIDDEKTPTRKEHQLEEKESLQERNEKDWTRMARIIDRFCFFLALLMTVGLLLFLLLGLFSRT